MNNCIVLAMLIVGVVAWWAFQLARGSLPPLYAARRCLRDHEPPGETRFWVRMMLSRALVVQEADSQGVVRKVSVLLFDMDRTKLALMVSEPERSAPRVDGEKYSVGLQRYVAANPQLATAPVEVWAMFNEKYGSRFIAERRVALDARKMGEP